MSYESKLGLSRANDGTLGVHQDADESLAERQVRLLESIDRKLDMLVNQGQVTAMPQARRRGSVV